MLAMTYLLKNYFRTSIKRMVRILYRTSMEGRTVQAVIRLTVLRLKTKCRGHVRFGCLEFGTGLMISPSISPLKVEEILVRLKQGKLRQRRSPDALKCGEKQKLHLKPEQKKQVTDSQLGTSKGQVGRTVILRPLAVDSRPLRHG